MDIVDKFLLLCKTSKSYQNIYGKVIENLDEFNRLLIEAKDNNIYLPYNKGCEIARINGNYHIIELLFNDLDIRKNLDSKSKIFAFEVALNKDNIEIIKNFLFDKGNNFSIYPPYYLRRNNTKFNPFPSKFKFGKEIESLLLTIQLDRELTFNAEIPIIKKRNLKV